MSLLLYYLFLHTPLFTHFTTTAHSSHPQKITSNHQCTFKCGNFQIPFPFHLNNNTSPPCSKNPPLISPSFTLNCINNNSSSSLYLTISTQTYRILQFFPNAILVDFPNSTICRQYNDLKSFPFTNSNYFAISTDNFVDLYGCDDNSSLCKTDCEKTFVNPNCDRQRGGYPSCCYPLSDRSDWNLSSDGFSGFERFGCRGFYSWAVLPESGRGQRGVKLEWAVPLNSTAAICAANADVVNATSVVAGIRCECRDGFVGDGFAGGVGCIKSCFKKGKEVHGNDCYPKKGRKRTTILLAGVIVSVLTAVSLMVFFYLWKRRSTRTDKFVSYKADCTSPTLSPKICKPRLFSYHELEEATKGFDDGQKIADGATTKMYSAILTEGLHVAVQRVQCESESDCSHVIFRVEALSLIFHQNMARVLGWSIVSGYSPLIVYEHPENGTLEEHLHRARYQNTPLDWPKRLNIAAETAGVLAFLHHKNSPPIFHNNLRSGCIFLDANFSVKLAGFEMNGDQYNKESCPSSETSEVPKCRKNDICSLGSVLLEMITGKMASKSSVLQKIKKGKLEEIVDPILDYHEQPPFCKEQIEAVADIATRCLLFGADGKLGAEDVAKELAQIAEEIVDGSSRIKVPDETFSNSSLLQMISMSPDSSFVP